MPRGNVDPTPAIHRWIVVAPDPDVDAPDTTIDSGPDTTTVVTEATFTFTSDDPSATFECRYDGSGSDVYTPCTSPATEPGGLVAGPFAVGGHVLEVRARSMQRATPTRRPPRTGGRSRRHPWTRRSRAAR